MFQSVENEESRIEQDLLVCDWFFSSLLSRLSFLFAFHQMDTTKIQNQKRVPESLKKQLALAVRSIQWSYAIFWTISDTQPGYSKFLLLSVLAYPCSASLLFLLKYIHFSFEQGYKMNKHSSYFVLIYVKMIFCSGFCSFLSIGSA